MKIKEKVLEILPMISINTKNEDIIYQRDLVVRTDKQYPKDIALTFKGANCKLLDAVQPGDTVEVTFDISSRKVNDRYYTTLTAWKINIVESKSFAATAAQNAAPATENGNVIHPQ